MDSDDKTARDAALIRATGGKPQMRVVRQCMGLDPHQVSVSQGEASLAPAEGGGADRNGPVRAVAFSKLISSVDKLNALVRLFPSLRKKDPPRFEQGGSCNPFVKWAKLSCMSHGEILAARFIVEVWTGGKKAGLKKFDLYEAMGTWDQEHREAFMVWCRDPFWP